MKKIYFFIGLILVLTIIPNLVLADTISSATANAYGIKETKSLDWYFGYEASTTGGVWYNKTLNFTPADRVGVVHASIIRIIAGSTSANPVTHDILVNNSLCNVSSITSGLGKTQYVADFDCKNIVNGSGVYIVSYMSSVSQYNAHYRLYITYDNDPDFLTPALLQWEFEQSMKLESNHDYCINSTHLGKDLLYSYSVNNETSNVTRSEVITCNYGCDSDRSECIPDPVTRYAWLLVLIFGFIVAMIILWKVFS